MSDSAPGGHDVSRGLPTAFPSAEKGFALYEDIPYEEYWEDPAMTHQNLLEQRLVSDLLPARGQRIIDIGCGYGRLLPCYADRFADVVLFDGSVSLLRHARESAGGCATLVAGDVAHLPFKPASFDAILSIRVLQHLADLEGALRGVQRILARDGRFVFSYHNKRNAHRILHYLKSRRVSDPFSLDSAEVSPTLISHHPSRVAALLASVGLSEPLYRGAVAVDSVANITGKLGRQAPSGLVWAGFTGRHMLAPWLIGRSLAESGDALRQADSINDLFECPACRGDLTRSDSSFECTACHRGYPIREGIIDFRLQERE